MVTTEKNENPQPSNPEGYKEFAKPVTQLSPADLKELVDGPQDKSNENSGRD